MFTGLIEGIGKIELVQRVGDHMILKVAPPFGASECVKGESVAIDGVCLTVTEVGAKTLTMDVSHETLSRSTLGRLKPGDLINVERALRLGDRLGGHLVLGHVDGIGKISSKKELPPSWVIRIELDSALSRYIIEKGSIAVDGISLTVNWCRSSAFEVNIIPETARQTTLIHKRVGDPVNIETDMIGKYVERLLKRATSGEENFSETQEGITKEKLLRLGFGE